MNEPEIDFRNLPEIFSQAGKELTFTMLGLIQLGAEGTTAVLAAICSVIHYIETDLGYPIRREIDKLIDDAVECIGATKH